jgi:hypothetical protein
MDGHLDKDLNVCLILGILLYLYAIFPSKKIQRSRFA